MDVQTLRWHFDHASINFEPADAHMSDCSGVAQRTKPRSDAVLLRPTPRPSPELHERAVARARAHARTYRRAQRQQRSKFYIRMEWKPTQERTHARALAHTHARARAWAADRRCLCTSAPGFATAVTMAGPTSAPGLRPHSVLGLAHICTGLAHICAGTRPHRHRDTPTPAPGLASAHICARRF